MTSAHDRWLANYHHEEVDVYCTNRECADYGEPQTVDYESEYGQGWITPEECPTCNGEFSFEAPPEIEEDEDE